MSLRAGDWVEVRSAEEILATLDDRGELDALPFMPEMLQYCGRRFRVFKAAHKTCDTIKTYHGRSMTDAVHLEGLRCDGGAHGGCQAGCLLFWKAAWLRPATAAASNGHPRSAPVSPTGPAGGDREALARATRAPAGDDGEERYRCQATELLRATAPLRWWDPRQYARDLLSGNVRLRDFLRYVPLAMFNALMRRHWRLRPYPNVRGLARDKTPKEVLDLQPGELVQVRSKAEIMPTLDGDRKNRGLAFDVEMLPFCGRTFRVLRRVERIVDDRTGRMLRMRSACLILDDVTCSGCFSTNRLFCPRNIYPYWHEIWLRRATQGAESAR